MNPHLINTYLERAREIIGVRSSAEIEYDDAVVAHLNAGMDIKKAIGAANKRFPKEALKPTASHWADLAERYDYIAQHKVILKRLGIRG
ncbi:MAG: hypothetical protein WCP06_11670 [Verrucomicrobiota bacterium]